MYSYTASYSISILYGLLLSLTVCLGPAEMVLLLFCFMISQGAVDCFFIVLFYLFSLYWLVIGEPLAFFAHCLHVAEREAEDHELNTINYPFENRNVDRNYYHQISSMYLFPCHAPLSMASIELYMINICTGWWAGVWGGCVQIKWNHVYLIDGRGEKLKRVFS